jgi:hypothetical protein
MMVPNATKIVRGGLVVLVIEVGSIYDWETHDNFTQL